MKLKNFTDNKKIIVVIMFFIVIIADIIMYSRFIYNDRSKYESNHIAYDSKFELNGKNEIKQTFIATGDNLEAVVLGFDKSFRTYSKDNIKIKIIDTTENKVIAEYDNIYNATVKNEKEYKFCFEKQKYSKGKEYAIIVSYENGTAGNPLLYLDKKEYQEGKLTVNGEEKSSNISFKAIYNSKYANIIFGISLVGLSMLSIIALTLVIYKKINIEKLMVLFTLIVGSIYVFAIPIYRGHDEHAHFFRAYEISEGVFNTPIIDNHSMTQIPTKFLDVLHEDYNQSERWANQAYYDDVIRSRNVKIDKNNTCYVGGEYMAVYSPIPYLVQAFTIKVTSLFTNNLLFIFYMTRIANLLFAILILYLAMKVIPFGKKVLLFIVIIPTTLSQMASVSPDALTITSSILFIAYLLKVIKSKEKVNYKDITILSIIGLVVGLCKIVYIPFVLLTLLIPKEKYRNKKEKWIARLSIILIPIIANLLWLGIANSHLVLIDNNKSNAQKLNILSNVFEYARICFYTLYNQFDLYINQLFGGYMEHIETVNVGTINVIAYIILFLLVILFDEDCKGQLNKNMKIAISSILFVICCLIFTSIYMQWSSLKWYYINGIQGRYFIEMLLPFMLVLAQNKLVVKSNNVNLAKILMCSGIILNMFAVLSCVIAYI